MMRGLASHHKQGSPEAMRPKVINSPVTVRVEINEPFTIGNFRVCVTEVGTHSEGNRPPVRCATIEVTDLSEGEQQ